MSKPPKHFTRQPWWTIPIAAVLAGLLPLLRYGSFKRNIHGVTLQKAMLTIAALGGLAATILVLRSHIRSTTWANVVLWVGILVITLGICVVEIFCPIFGP